ncbi:RNA polymerase sigma factor [Actinoplanes sp. DH11]|uniref:RNA polymerase sigma factor n=1 Tax=Actinoplanes sp. DH11 TaxID=2857011 RepID=UPI001E551B7B|nr:RNA polymerase sigma factor [Actinoplanes sp. DH11]
MSSEDRFRRLYAANVEALLAFAVRRVEQPADAADVVAETFLVAWRRSDDLPPDDEIKLWLYGVARRVLANHHRGGARRERLGERLRQRLSTVSPDPGADVPQRVVVRAALNRLPAADREILMLTVWEGLQPREVAEVIGASAVVVRARLSRARRRMRDLLGHDPGTPGHVLDVLTVTAPEEGR